MMRCKQCILPDTASGVILDENGLCQLCNDMECPPAVRQMRLGYPDRISLG